MRRNMRAYKLFSFRDLVRAGELSRVAYRADAAQLAQPSAFTISCLAKLHPQQTQTPLLPKNKISLYAPE